MKPTSDQIHIGNYFGAVKPFFDLISADPTNEAYFMIVNMHALTTLHDPIVMRKNTIDFCRLYVALLRHYGLDESQICIFNQASISAHAQLGRILGCVTHM
ncbi:hypothetical protein KAZ93_00615 [Patescibacteria group bacterium]|nr:hypothetical protein [Patescibacteria group bacterium]